MNYEASLLQKEQVIDRFRERVMQLEEEVERMGGIPRQLMDSLQEEREKNT